MGHRITQVEPGSPAAQAGIRVGDSLLCLNHTPIVDMVDYEYLSAEAALSVTVARADGTEETVTVEKQPEEPLGLSFETTLMSSIRTCKNHCIFCFIDQMHPGGRSSLHMKDDDWRLSFIMGNYITLTNVDEAEFQRILQRRVAPLYISVHATDPEVRIRMMRNPTAGKIRERLFALKEAGLPFHCQIVACPGINDGAVLEQTLTDLCALRPAMRSVAVVPVGLTRFREGLYPLRCFTKEEAVQVLATVEAFQDRCCQSGGEPTVYASDEFYLLAQQPLPSAESYGEYEQIENGVGLLRLFEEEFHEALAEKRPRLFPRRIAAAGGVSAQPVLKELMQELEAYRIHVSCYPIRNDYFGPTVTVGGLVTGGDLIAQLQGRIREKVLIIPRTMLREGEDVFLDGKTVQDVQQALGVRVLPVTPDGAAYIETIWRNAV